MEAPRYFDETFKRTVAWRTARERPCSGRWRRRRL